MNQTSPQLHTFAKGLNQIDRWLTKSAEYAESRKFDPNLLLAARLAPDQFAFARITDQKPPSHPDTEATIDELRARIRAVVDYLGTFDDAAIEAGTDRHVSLPQAPGKYLLGSEYLQQFAIPNFYFHLATAYAILRHNGVPLGKMDFLGRLPFHDV